MKGKQSCELVSKSKISAEGIFSSKSLWSPFSLSVPPGYKVHLTKQEAK